MKPAEIWEKDSLYYFLRWYVDLCTRLSYRRFKIEGKLPSDGAVILAANHTNTLMDALVMLPFRHRGIAFGARADIFRRPAAARILHWLKIVPMVRLRDGIREVARNRDTLAEVDHILEHGMPFALFPEGRHRPMHSLLPLQKGISRIAMESAAHRPTSIVPVGIDYSAFFRYRSTCHIKLGSPIDVNAFLQEHAAQPEAEQHHLLLERIADGIKEKILWFPADDSYCESINKLNRKRRPWQLPLAVLTFPLWLCAAVLSLPLWALAEWLCRRKIKDAAFRNTARYMVRLLALPLWLLILAVPALILLPLWAAALLILAAALSYSAFYDWLNLVRGPEPPILCE